MSQQSTLAYFFSHLNLVRRKAFEDFDLATDMLLGTFIAGLNLLMLVHYGLIDTKDWREHKWLWVLCTVAPYVVVLACHAVWRLMIAPSLIHREQQDKLIRAETREAEALRKIYDGRPVIVMDILQPDFTNDRPGEFVFVLQNCGIRTARWVKIEPIASGLRHHMLYFEQITVLAPGPYRAVSHWVDDGKPLDKPTLLKFLQDQTVDAAVTWHDFAIEFTDADGSVRENDVRLVFDLQSKALVVRACPTRPS